MPYTSICVALRTVDSPVWPASRAAPLATPSAALPAATPVAPLLVIYRDFDPDSDI
jgi:hypothetical protein